MAIQQLANELVTGNSSRYSSDGGSTRNDWQSIVVIDNMVKIGPEARAAAWLQHQDAAHNIYFKIFKENLVRIW